MLYKMPMKNISLENNKNLSYNTMSKNIRYNVKYLHSLTRQIDDDDTKEKALKVVKLYEERKIPQLQTAENIILNFITAKHTKNPMKAKTANKRFEKTYDKYKEQKPLKERLTKTKKYYVNGKIHVRKTSEKTNNRGET